MEKEYYLGLDIGTDSIGWAVTDTNYKILKFNGNAMWGIRLFDKSQTAEDRRTYRTSRRRIQRRRERLALFEMLFNEEISKVDPAFFIRLKESNLLIEDREDINKTGKYTVFNDKDYNDKDFHKAFPTVYHLRRELIKNKEPHDVRLVFIALHHIIKKRGHFLFDTDVSDIPRFEEVYKDLADYLSDNYEIDFPCDKLNECQEILKSKKESKTAKFNAISAELGIDKKEKQKSAVLSLMCGLTTKICDIFDDESLKDPELEKITLNNSFDEKASDYESLLGERYELIEKIKAVYDWSVLADVLDGEKYISYAKVKIYEEHKDDLQQLKMYVRKYFPEKYKDIFKKSKDKLNNYVAYSGHVKTNGRTGVVEGRCNEEDFCTFLRKELVEIKDESYADMFSRIKNNIFMPKQSSANNGVIPMQVNRIELKAILENAKEYLPFLNNKDENGISVYDKILSLFDFRIPYYVGPLNTHSKRAWLCRKEGEKIYPWNFEKIVDVDSSAQKFIENLTSKCTYLPDKDVIPKNSLLYTKYMVLNELNNLRIDSQKIDVQLKQDIFDDLFKKHYKVTNKRLRDYLTSKGIEFDSDSISGIDGDFKSSLKSFIDFEKSEFSSLSDGDKEDIIHSITIFGDDKKLLKKRLKEKYKNIDEKTVSKISKLKYSGWSGLSREFLTEIECIKKETGELTNIISALWDTNDNLNQILYSDNYSPTFIEKINEMNSFDNEKTLREIVDDLYVSPKVKRPIYQSIQIIKEIEKIEKCHPKKIFVEVPRYTGEKKRTNSRKAQLLELYKKIKFEYCELYDQLNGTDEENLRSDKLYLYFTQLGECIYTGEKIDLDDLLSNNSLYDIDHIFPQSKIKDDSILNNRVLSLKTYNNSVKRDHYPLPSKTREERRAFWKKLLENNLITKTKYERLIRNTELTDEELTGFISRQIVETGQSTKAVAKLLEMMYPNTETVYVKAGIVSDFRNRDYNKDKMSKSRDVNDLHHAKDAYLNIVVGNVYNEKFTHDRANFIKGLKADGKDSKSLNKIFDYDIKGVWVAENNESLNQVINTMNKNNILYTRYSYKQQGELFKANILKKGKGQIPIKSGKRSDISKYGGYDKAKSAYFALVEYDEKKNRIRKFVPIDIVKEKAYLLDPVKFMENEMNLKNPKIVLPCIKYNSCISLNGFRMHLSCKTGEQIKFRPGVQLVVSPEQEIYIKRISKFCERQSKKPDIKVDEKHDKISKEENIEIFDVLIYKMTNTIFKEKFKDFGSKLSLKRDIFVGLECEKQCKVIREMLKILHNDARLGDLSLIGEAKNCGAIYTSLKISKMISLKLINQSVTGLFEIETDLLK